MDLKLSQPHLTWTLAKLTAGRIMRRRSRIFFLLLGLVPSLAAGYWMVLKLFPNDISRNFKPYEFFLTLQNLYFMSFYLLVLAAFLGLGVIMDEIETKNITFTLVRPLNRVSIIAGRFLGHLLAGWAYLAISFTCCFLANMLFQTEDLFAKIPAFFNGLFILSFGLTAFMGIVSAMGTFLSRFALLAAVIWMIFDFSFSMAPLKLLNFLSIRYHMLASYWEGIPQFLPTLAVIRQTPASLNALVCLGFCILACFVTALRLKSEIILSDGSN